MVQIWPYLAILIFFLHDGGVYSYMIDNDCGDDTQFVRDRINTAFRLISNAVTEFNKETVNPEVNALYNTLFGRDFDPKPPSIVKSRFEALLSISQHNNNDQTSDGIVDVRFYCTAKRIVKIKKGKYKNQDRGIVYEPGELTSPGGQLGNCFDIKPPTLMITLTMGGKDYSEIQICPWFLHKARGFKVKDLADIPSSAWTSLSKLVMPVVAKVVYSPIDSFLLMDKIIVHELTHTLQARPATRDFSDPDGYGFKNAQKIVSDWKNHNQESTRDPVMNADSNALFAVGAWILVQPGAQPIAADGTFNKPGATPKARI